MSHTAVAKTNNEQDRIIREHELRSIVPYSSMHIWRSSEQAVSLGVSSSGQTGSAGRCKRLPIGSMLGRTTEVRFARV